MDVMHIKGGHPLQGSVAISGAKNAALPIFAATLLTDETCYLEGVPDLSDIRFMAELLRHLGAAAERREDGVWEIRAETIGHVAPYDLVRKMRASICLLGPLVSRCRRARISMPGGCVIGPRPIDLHLKGLARLHCKVTTEAGYVDIDARDLRGDYLFLGGRHGSTVTGTANLVMAAVLAPGITRIESAAVEPEVVDLCHMLVKMGAHIDGIGSHYLRITGVEKLHGCRHKVVSDRIEAGTYLIAGAMTGGRGHRDRHRHRSHALPCSPSSKKRTVPVARRPRSRHHHRRGPRPTRTKRSKSSPCPTPGFPPTCRHRCWPWRPSPLASASSPSASTPIASCTCPSCSAWAPTSRWRGPTRSSRAFSRLSGAPVMASDLRASAALVLAGLAAEGETWVQRLYHLDRGYDRLCEKLQTLGAQVERLPGSAMPNDLIES
jgi:UDP-N-acetylglucosamine 1-carboxyvinyltransferase